MCVDVRGCARYRAPERLWCPLARRAPSADRLPLVARAIEGPCLLSEMTLTARSSGGRFGQKANAGRGVSVERAKVGAKRTRRRIPVKGRLAPRRLGPCTAIAIGAALLLLGLAAP